jgi:hypothetical protein
MADRIKGISEVHIEDKQVPVGVLGIFEHVDQALQVAGSVMAHAKALLCRAENTEILRELGQDHSDKPGPEFVDGVVHADRAFITEVGRVITLV